MSERRPFARRFGKTIYDVAPVADGVAVLVEDRIVVVDGKLETIAEVARGECTRENDLVALGPSRFLAWEGRFSRLWVGPRGGTLEPVEAETPYFDKLVAMTTNGGFAAASLDRLVIDDGRGARTFPTATGKAGKGLAALADVVVSVGFEGVAVFDASGAEIARDDEVARAGAPAAVGDVVVVPTSAAALFFDARLGRRGSVALASSIHDRTATPFGSEVLVADSDAVHCVPIGGSEVRWSFHGTDLMPPIAVGERVVVGTWARKSVSILDRDGSVVAELALGDFFHRAAPFGDGIAITDRETLRHWTPDATDEQVDLPHDGAPWSLVDALGGIVSTDGDALYLWRVDEDGPPVAPLATAMPLDTPIVVGASVLTLRPGGRYRLRAFTAWGERTVVEPDATFRPVTSRDEATAIMKGLAERKSEDSPVPLDEVAFALGTTARALRAAIRAGKFPFEAPRAIPGWEYVGRFTTEGKLTISDPCYVGKAKTKFPLSHSVDALDGRWHAYVRPYAEDSRRTAELVVVHESAFDVVAVEPIGVIGVDAGLAGVFDKSVRFDHDAAQPYDEGIVGGGRGAIASTGWGDGGYGAYAGTKNGKVAKVRIHFLGPESPAIDSTLAKAGAAAKPYAATATFEVGDVVEHKKFGQGTVVRLPAKGKVEIAFGDELKVLVHGLT